MMRKKTMEWGLILLFCLATGSGALCHAEKNQGNVEDKVYGWLKAHQTAGLVGNQETDSFSGVYSNALAAICFIHQGDADRAEKLFDVFQADYKNQFDTGTPMGFHQFWSARTGVVYLDTDRWVGDNAWLLIALNYYKQKTGKPTYDVMRDGMAKWILSLQDSDGGIMSGSNKRGKMDWKSTEGNLDAYVALVDYPEARAKIKNYLATQMWDPSEKRFKMGSTSDGAALDCISWGVATFGHEFEQSLDFAEKKLVRTETSDANKKKITGFSDFLDKDRVWLEGTGEMVVAYNAVGQKAKANKYLKQLEKAMVDSKLYKDTKGLPCSTNTPPWNGGSEKIFVPSQAWYLFGKWQFNPLNMGGSK